MTQMRIASSLLAPSVRKRIFGGFAVVLLLLAALAAITLRGMDAVSAGAGRVSQDSAQATASAEVALQVGEARALVVQYALTATMDDQKAAQASLTGSTRSSNGPAAAAPGRAATCRRWRHAIGRGRRHDRRSRGAPIQHRAAAGRRNRTADHRVGDHTGARP